MDSTGTQGQRAPRRLVPHVPEVTRLFDAALPLYDKAPRSGESGAPCRTGSAQSRVPKATNRFLSLSKLPMGLPTFGSAMKNLPCV